MPGRRRVVVALLAALALSGLVAAAALTSPAGEARHRAATAEQVLESHPTQPAVTPAKRQAAEQLTPVVVAVLVALLGLVGPGRQFSRRRRARDTLPAFRAAGGVRLRAPPTFGVLV